MSRSNITQHCPLSSVLYGLMHVVRIFQSQTSHFIDGSNHLDLFEMTFFAEPVLTLEIYCLTAVC